MNRLGLDGIINNVMQLVGLIGMFAGMCEDMILQTVFCGIIYLAYVEKEEHRKSKEMFVRLLYGKAKSKQESNGRCNSSKVSKGKT